MEKKSVIIANDDRIFRSRLQAFIDTDPSFCVVAEAADCDEAVDLVARLRPHIAILDFSMSKAKGFAVLASLRKLRTRVLPVMLTMLDDEAMFAKAFDLGVRGYVSKERAAVDIVDCLHMVSNGQIYTSAAVATFLVKRASSQANDAGGLESLTPAERMILRLIADDRSSPEIAKQLSISVRKVENHRSHIVSKVGVAGSQALFKFAVQHQSELL